jgi:broad specificity phosphatase PhoE
MCRSAETARYLFGVGYRIDPRLMHEDPAGGRGIETASKEMRALLAELAPIPEGSNVAVVGHGGVIHRATGLALSEGEIGVVRVGADGATEAVGQVLGSDFAPLARQALQTKDAAHPTPNSPHSR